jgi:hypothetical protein
VNISDAYKTIGALAGTVVLAFGAVNVFQTRAAADEQKQQIQRSVEELRAEILLNRIAELNAKEAKEPLTPAEKTERELLLAQVKALQAPKK